MKFEISERVVTKRSQEEVLSLLEDQFRKVSDGINRSGQIIEAKSIEASFGSINRKDVTYISAKKTTDGWLLVADVSYKPSVAFWIILILMLFTWVFWLIPIAFYLLQKDTVKNAITVCFQRVKNEFDQSSGSSTASTHTNTSNGSAFEDIEKLGAMKEKGLLTAEEFDQKKKQILGL